MPFNSVALFRRFLGRSGSPTSARQAISPPFLATHLRFVSQPVFVPLTSLPNYYCRISPVVKNDVPKSGPCVPSNSVCVGTNLAVTSHHSRSFLRYLHILGMLFLSPAPADNITGAQLLKDVFRLDGHTPADLLWVRVSNLGVAHQQLSPFSPITPNSLSSSSTDIPSFKTTREFGPCPTYTYKLLGKSRARNLSYSQLNAERSGAFLVYSIQT